MLVHLSWPSTSRRNVVMRQWEKEKTFQAEETGENRHESGHWGAHVWAAQGARGSSSTVSQWYDVWINTQMVLVLCSTDGIGNFFFFSLISPVQPACPLALPGTQSTCLTLSVSLSPLYSRPFFMTPLHCWCRLPANHAFLLRLATHSRTATNHTP